jgi:hypothetical protein
MTHLRWRRADAHAEEPKRRIGLLRFANSITYELIHALKVPRLAIGENEDGRRPARFDCTQLGSARERSGDLGATKVGLHPVHMLERLRDVVGVVRPARRP